MVYTGITSNISRRIKEHAQGKTRTTRRFNKMKENSVAGFKEVRYRELKEYELEKYEKTFKKYGTEKKLKISGTWLRWEG